MATISHADGEVTLQELPDGRQRVQVRLTNPHIFMRQNEFTTAMPTAIIERIVATRGPGSVCDELMRDEDPRYLEQKFRHAMLSFVPPDFFVGKRLLDFGCGWGASSMVLSRMFPQTEIVGVDLLPESLEVARLRSAHYSATNVTFLQSPAGSVLPPRIGRFDAIVLSAVYEHLLPDERGPLLTALWDHLAPGGVLFINETPHRYFPIETHTTLLPLLNYLPDRLTHALARRFSRKHPCRETWPTLLRMGIRGGTQRDIVRRLDPQRRPHRVLPIITPGINDEIDLWYQSMSPMISPLAKQATYRSLKMLGVCTGICLTTTITMAIEKSGAD